MEVVRTTDASPPAPLGERRQVSVLFVDAVGYTAIAEQLGEERTLAFVRVLYEIMAGAVREHGGVVRGFAGDGLMGLFGIPDAYEDTALRACRAAAAIHAAIARATEGIAAQFGVRPVLRVGISSGVVVMAAVEGDGASVSAIGDTVNLASRIEALAPPGGTMICETTQRLVAWYAETSFDGEHRIKGKSQPQKLWRLDAVRDGVTRFDASLGRGLSPFVGREAELGVLQDALRRARDGLEVIDLVAEPGLGKTRLVYEFQRQLAAGEARVLTGHCTTDGRNIPFLPFLELTRSVCGIGPEDSPAGIAGKTELHETLDSKGCDEAGMGAGHSMDKGKEGSMDMEGDGSMDMEGEGSMDMESSQSMDMEMDSMKCMKQVSSIELPAGETVNLEPGGFHVMLFDLAKPIEQGETFEVTLSFANGDDAVAEVTARDRE